MKFTWPELMVGFRDIALGGQSLERMPLGQGLHPSWAGVERSPLQQIMSDSARHRKLRVKPSNVRVFPYA